MENVDFKREYSDLYRQSAQTVSLVDVPEFGFLKIDGAGDPNSASEYTEAVETLYPLCYGVRALAIEELERKYTVMPLEGLWWADDMEAFRSGERDDWEWTMMIMQPPFVTAEMVDRAVDDVREEKDVPALSKVRFESYNEGLAAQVLHVGPYSEEGPTIERLHEFIADEGYELRGHHPRYT